MWHRVFQEESVMYCRRKQTGSYIVAVQKPQKHRAFQRMNVLTVLYITIQFAFIYFGYIASPHHLFHSSLRGSPHITLGRSVLGANGILIP